MRLFWLAVISIILALATIFLVSKAVVTSNYGICNENSAQLVALQEWAAGVGKLNPNPL